MPSLARSRFALLLTSTFVTSMACSTLTRPFLSGAYASPLPPETEASTPSSPEPPLPSLPSAVPSSPCPIDDMPYCDFVYFLQPLVESGEIDAILQVSRQHDCMTSGGYHPGWDPHAECSQDLFCVNSGVLEGEGGCVPLSEFRSFWRSTAYQPLTLSGIVYPSIPGLDQSDDFNGPAILVSTGHPEYDWILLCALSEDTWSISYFLRQLRSARPYQTPEDIVIPWQ